MLACKFFFAVGGGVEPPTVQLATIQRLGGQPQSTRVGIILRLSCYHHPRDRRAWLPVSSSYNRVKKRRQ
jgi:hypothetical protein